MVPFVVSVLLVLSAAGLRRRSLSARQVPPPWLVAAGGLLAWAILAASAWTCWSAVRMLIDFSVFSVLTLAAILVGTAFLYQYVVTMTEAGSLPLLLRDFFSMLMFRSAERKSDDIFAELERMEMERALEEERKASDASSRPPDEDHKNAFGS